jgi:hypothetical protein
MLSIETSITVEGTPSCLQCGKRFDGPAAFCSRCGTRRASAPLLSRRRQTFYFKSATAAVLILVVGVISLAARQPRASKAATPAPPARVTTPAKPNPFLEKLLDIDATLATRPVVTAPTTRPVASPAKPPARRRTSRP